MARYADVQYIRLYTDGSAARKLEVPSVIKQQPRRKRKAQKKIILHVDPVAILGLAVAAVMLILMLTGVSELRAAQQKTAQMEQYVVSLEQNNAQLEESYHSGYDIDEVEKMALALGMVPQEEAEQVTMQVTPIQEEQTGSVWTNIWTFLTGLFA